MSSNEINLFKLDEQTVRDFNEYMSLVISKRALVHSYKNIWYYKSEYLNKLHETVYNYAQAKDKNTNTANSINNAFASLQSDKTLPEYLYEFGNDKEFMSFEEYNKAICENFGYR